MKRIELIQTMHRHRLVAVVRSKSAEEALATARAAAEGGINFVEITFSVPGALGVIKMLAGRPDLLVGAGTVLSRAQADQALAAGANFIVSPTLEPDLIPGCHEADVVCISGAATPNEILTAARAGADLVKVFPADCVGGSDFIRQMSGPFPEIRFMVSGGINLNNVASYVKLGVTGICLGSALLADILANNGHGGLVDEVRRYVASVEKALAASLK